MSVSKSIYLEGVEQGKILRENKKKVTGLRLLVEILCEITDIKELTSTLVDSFTERIEVYNNDKSSSHCYAKVDVYFTAVGMIDIPTEREILAMMEEI